MPGGGRRDHRRAPRVLRRPLGSRVDDRKLGGDVDLLVESDSPIDNPAFLAAQLSARLQRKMHGRKVDVFLLAPNLRPLLIHDIALGEGSTVVKIPAATRGPTPA